MNVTPAPGVDDRRAQQSAPERLSHSQQQQVQQQQARYEPNAAQRRQQEQWQAERSQQTSSRRRDYGILRTALETADLTSTAVSLTNSTHGGAATGLGVIAEGAIGIKQDNRPMLSANVASSPNRRSIRPVRSLGLKL